MATYKFKNHELLMTDPTIISAFVNGLYPNELEIDVLVKFSTPNSESAVQLMGVPVLNLNYDANELIERINDYLNNPANGYIQS